MKTFTTVILLLIGVLMVLALILFVPVTTIYKQYQKTSNRSREIYTHLKNQDLDSSKAKISDFKKDLADLRSTFNTVSWLKFVPFISSYIADVEHVINASIYSTEGVEIAIDTLIPYSDLLGLKGKSTFVSGSADERIAKAVETLDKIIPSIDSIAQKIEKSESELENINESRYPVKVGRYEIRPKIIQAKQLYKSTASLFVEAQPLLKKIPHLLGTAQVRRYLVLFQNDAELRATGGFITAYAVFKVDNGKLQVETADDIYKLDEAKSKTFPAPTPIVKYHKNVNLLQIRDSNLSPDYVQSMMVLEKMIKESINGFPEIDGIMAIDTHVLVSAVKILGEFNVYGRTFSADIDKRCDCPKVIYELEDYATRPVAYVREARKDIIGVLLYQIMQRALGVSPSQYWGKLFQMLLDETQQKHVLLYFHDNEAQKGIDALNFSGKIVSFNGDYLHINNVNFAGAKSNLFVKQSVRQDYKIDSDGTIIKTVTITYKNPAPASNCNLEAGKLCLNGILRNWLRVYVPKESQLIEFIGSEKETVTYQDLDKTVFEGFATVKPQGQAQVIVRYKLPFKSSTNFALLIQKQPGTDDEEYQIFVKDKMQEKLLLTTDIELKINK